MPCYGPLTAYYSRDVNPETGRRPLVFDSRKSHSGIPIKLPCGQCVGCRLSRAANWAIRCMHEKKLHDQSSFVTITYDNANLPVGGSLDPDHFTLFMKRLRDKRPKGLRFFASGEYGETRHRPHYHVLLLNTGFTDLQHVGSSGSGEPLYHSDELRKLWPYGNNRIGEVTFESAAYTAAYCVKKITGEKAEEYYAGRVPPFSRMSLKPGIGLAWYERYKDEFYRNDSAMMSGREVRLPRYYDAKYEILDEKRMHRIKRIRRLKALKYRDDNSLRRMRVKEEFQLLKSRRFARDT